MIVFEVYCFIWWCCWDFSSLKNWVEKKKKGWMKYCGGSFEYGFFQNIINIRVVVVVVVVEDDEWSWYLGCTHLHSFIPLSCVCVAKADLYDDIWYLIDKLMFFWNGRFWGRAQECCLVDEINERAEDVKKRAKKL